MVFDQQPNVTAAELAEILHRLFVLEDNEFAKAECYNIPSNCVKFFHSRMELYREALVLISLRAKSIDIEAFNEVIKEYEPFILPREPTAGGLLKLDAINEAMRDLAIILRPSKDPNLTWSRNWFAAVGHDELNVITLFEFYIFWMDQYIALQEGLMKVTLV